MNRSTIYVIVGAIILLIGFLLRMRLFLPALGVTCILVLTLALQFLFRRADKKDLRDRVRSEQKEMTVGKARTTLGISEGASSKEIGAAYLKQMEANKGDFDRLPYLEARLNAAHDILIAEITEEEDMTALPEMTDAYTFDPTILRAYDVRGIVGQTLSDDDAYALGQALATKIIQVSGKDKPQIAVGYDGRHSSPHFEEAITSGMKSCGAHVVRIGCGPTPMLYYTVRAKELDGGVMITGSHNPPDYNGFKMMFAKAALFGEQIQELGEIAASGEFAKGEGSDEKISIFDEYVGRLLADYKAGGKALNVAWDAGNGAAGDVMVALADKLPGEHQLLYPEVSGDFPNHHPDPSEAENLEDVIESVKKHNCALGIAFDGDGDRIGVVDSKGRILWGDQLMQLFAKDVLAGKPGATIIADVKASQTLFDKIDELGGNSMIWKTGHSFIKSKMAEENAALAGEMSGHIFFADNYYGFDDALYAAIRLLNFLSHEEKTLDELLDEMEPVCNTPEMRIEVSEERKFKIIEEVQERLKADNVKFSDIDGVRVMNDSGWWLLRASNTQAALSARCEAKNEALLEDMKNHLKTQLKMSGVDI